ncbi:MAG: hypothetical protein ACRDBX_00340 [Erysipelotrichaceae bacterium]
MQFVDGFFYAFWILLGVQIVLMLGMARLTYLYSRVIIRVDHKKVIPLDAVLQKLLERLNSEKRNRLSKWFTLRKLRWVEDFVAYNLSYNEMEVVNVEAKEMAVLPNVPTPATLSHLVDVWQEGVEPNSFLTLLASMELTLIQPEQGYEYNPETMESVEPITTEVQGYVVEKCLRVGLQSSVQPTSVCKAVVMLKALSSHPEAVLETSAIAQNETLDQGEQADEMMDSQEVVEIK